MCLSKHPQKTSGTQKMCSWLFYQISSIQQRYTDNEWKELECATLTQTIKAPRSLCRWAAIVAAIILCKNSPFLSFWSSLRRSHSLTTACHPCPAITNANLAVEFSPWWQNTLSDLWGPSESDIWLPSHLCDLHLFWLMINLCQQLYSRSKSPASTFKPPAEHPPRS